VEPLARALSDSNDGVRYTAAYNLGLFRTAGAPVLIDALARGPMNRRLGNQALKSLTGQDFGFDPWPTPPRGRRPRTAGSGGTSRSARRTSAPASSPPAPCRGRRPRAGAPLPTPRPPLPCPGADPRSGDPRGARRGPRPPWRGGRRPSPGRRLRERLQGLLPLPGEGERAGEVVAGQGIPGTEGHEAPVQFQALGDAPLPGARGGQEGEGLLVAGSLRSASSMIPRGRSRRAAGARGVGVDPHGVPRLPGRGRPARGRVLHPTMGS